MTKSRAPGFSLLEIIVASAVLLILVGVMFSIINQTSRVVTSASGRIDAFQSSRAAFESMTRTISQATLNTYYDYFDSRGRSPADSGYDGVPFLYGRQSDLHFVTGKSCVPGQLGHAVFFQAPLGFSGPDYEPLEAVLSACGYYVTFASDASDQSLSGRAAFLDGLTPFQFRCRLMQFTQPAEELQLYRNNGSVEAWFKDPLAATPPSVRILCDNIVLLVVRPSFPGAGSEELAADYEYNSRRVWDGTLPQPAECNQVPPLLQILLVALDESSASRVQGRSAEQPDLGIRYSELFHVTERWTDDLSEVEKALTERHLNYRIFNTTIALPAAKWSRE